ncbi:MAG: YfhO family protein [Ruminococcus sp.]|nr:YfhO family protein [Ruminococcus sp.]
MDNKKGKTKTSGSGSSAAYRRFRQSRFCRLMYDKGVLYFALSFIIPALLMLIGFKKQHIHPFGTEQMLVVDLWHQYYPFFRVVREKLLTGGSFLYSWQNGMGTNFLSLISYYAASPLNWISVLFDEDHVRDALSYILIAKVGFCGAFFSCFLRYTYKRKDLSIVVFSSMFALCSYVLGYYWNVMWFDTVALFPLVMTGVTAICRERKWKLYTLSLALSLIANYYIGYFTCIFTMFMFAASVIIEGKGIKDFFVKLWIIIRSSVIGIGLGAFMLLPAYYGLQLTYSANNTFPMTRSWYEKWTDIFANLLSYSPPAMKEGLPNFACGMLAVVLFGVFLFSGGIKIREKIAGVLMLALIAVSCNMNQLNFIWHGFHVTNQIPYRFAFIFSFVLVAAAFRGYDAMTKKGISIWQLILLIPAPAAVFWLNWRKAGEDFAFEGAFRSSVIITAAYLLIFAAAKLFPFKELKVRRSFLNVCIAVAVVAELASNAALGVKTVGSSGYTSYPASNEQVQEQLAQIRSEDETFARTEMTGTYTLNDSALYGYYGVSQFSSSANVSVTKLFQRLGLYASEAGNRYYYRTAGPVVNGLLGIKHLISKNGMMTSTELALDYKGSDSSGGTHRYDNKYALPLGFMMDSTILDLPEDGGLNPFEYQNDVIRLAAGTEQPVFTAQPVALASYENVDVVKTGYGSYDYTRPDSGLESTVKLDFAGIDGSYLYGYVNNGGAETINVTLDGATVDSNISVSDYPITFPMGDGQAGNTAQVTLKLKKDGGSGSYKAMIYALSKEAWDEAYSRLADEPFEIESFSDTKISGRLSAKTDGVLYLSIPYEKGWSIYIDGEKTETVPVLGAMLGARVSSGSHEVRLEYSPEGFRLGLLISGGALALFLLLAAAGALRRRRKSSPKPAEEEPSPEKEPAKTDEIPAPEVDDEKSESNDGLSGD